MSNLTFGRFIPGRSRHIIFFTAYSVVLEVPILLFDLSVPQVKSYRLFVDLMSESLELYISTNHIRPERCWGIFGFNFFLWPFSNYSGKIHSLRNW
jgi:hypothetical protein